MNKPLLAILVTFVVKIKRLLLSNDFESAGLQICLGLVEIIIDDVINVLTLIKIVTLAIVALFVRHILVNCPHLGQRPGLSNS